MKAAQYADYGDADVIKVTEIEVPAFKDGQVLVEARAAAINPFDSKLRSGMFKDGIPLTLPITISGDFSGVIMAVAADVADFKVGDEVYGSAMVLGGGSGALAEQIAANTASLALKPASLDFAHAAAVVLVGVSAIQALDQLNLGPDTKVLIHGGAGGIGSIAIQYAKHLGAHVATAVRATDTEFVKSLGADEVVDYENQQFEDVLSNYDAVFDTIGGDTYSRSHKVLKRGGIIISMVEKAQPELTEQYGVTALSQNTKVSTDSLNKLTELITGTAIEPKIDQEFPLDQVVEAFKHLESGNAKGKVVVTIKP